MYNHNIDEKGGITVKLEGYQAQAPFAQKHLLTLMDYTPDEIYQCLALGLHLKQQQKAGIAHEHLKGQSITIEFAEESVINIDGEAVFSKTADMKLERGALNLIVPNGSGFFS